MHADKEVFYFHNSERSISEFPVFSKFTWNSSFKGTLIFNEDQNTIALPNFSKYQHKINVYFVTSTSIFSLLINASWQNVWFSTQTIKIAILLNASK